MADEAKRRHRLRDRRAGVGDRGVGNAEQGDLGSAAGLDGMVATGELRRHSCEAGCGGDGPACPARSHHGQRRQGVRCLGRGGVAKVSFQFSHRRYQTAEVALAD
jgi:hypothetical protein